MLDIREYFEGMEAGDIRELPDDVWKTGCTWSLDVVFREDAALVSRGHGPKKRFTAAMNPDYMFTVIFGK